MDDLEKRKVLLSMGYRQPNKNIPIWMKPVGFCLFIVKTDEDKWYNYIRLGDSESLVHNSENLNTSNYLDSLRYAEAYTTIEYTLQSTVRDYNFLTMEQELSFIF